MNDHIATWAHTYRTYKQRVDALPRSILFQTNPRPQDSLELNQAFLARLKEVTKGKSGRKPGSRLGRLATRDDRRGVGRPAAEYRAKDDAVRGLIAGGTGAGKSPSCS